MTKTSPPARPVVVAYRRWMRALGITVVSCTLWAVALAGEAPDAWETLPGVPSGPASAPAK